MSHDGECAAVGVLVQLAGHGLQLGLGARGQVGGVGGEGDVAGQGDSDVLASGVGAGGVVQRACVALDGDGVSELGGSARVLVDVGLGCAQVHLGLLGLVGVQDGDGGEAGHGDHDGDGVGVDLAEGQVGDDLLAGGELQHSAAAVDGAPHAPGAGVEELDQVGAGARPKDGWSPYVA